MKKFIAGLFAAMLVVPTFNADLFAREDDYSEYNAANDVAEAGAVVSTITQDLIDKADKYVTIEDKQYVYTENTELTGYEVAQVKEAIAGANETIMRARHDGANYIAEQDGFIVSSNQHPMLSTYGFGFTGLHTHWWGIRVWLDRDDARWLCEIGGAVVGGLVALIPGIGWAVAGIIVGAVLAGVCHFSIWSGLWVDFNWRKGVTGWGWQ